MENPEVQVEQPEMQITDDDKLWGLLSWLLTPIVPIIALLMEDKKSRPFIKFHAVNALAFIVIGWVISGVLSVAVIGCFIPLVLFAYQIYMAIQAYQGEWTEVPGLTKVLKDQGWI